MVDTNWAPMAFPKRTTVMTRGLTGSRTSRLNRLTGEMVRIGDVWAPVSSAALWPGSAGVSLVRVQVPINVPVGDSVPLVIEAWDAGRNCGRRPTFSGVPGAAHGRDIRVQPHRPISALAHRRRNERRELERGGDECAYARTRGAARTVQHDGQGD